MNTVRFPEANTEFAKDQPQYKSMWALKYDTPHGHVVSCWQLSFRERLRILFTGKIWMSLMMFNKPLTPSYLTTIKREVVSLPDTDAAGD